MENKNISFEEEIISIINSGEPDSVIRDKLSNYHENDIAEILDDLDEDSRQRLYRIFGTEGLSEVFAYLDDVSDYLDEIGLENAADVIEQMDADDAVDALEDVDEDTREELISRMDDKSKEDIELISSYDEDEIGSRMTTNYVMIEQTYTIKQAMRSLIKQANENDNINTLYVEDENGKYYGAIDLKDLITARDYVDINTIISTSYPYLNATERVSDCITKLMDYAEDSIPVLDENRVIIGVITSSDIIEAVDDELSEDYAKFAGLTAEEDLNETLPQSMGKRLPWLFLLLFLGMGVSSVVGIFEGVVAQIAIIVCFQSLILDMAGNVGTQSLAVTIRVLTDENISFGQKIAFIFKEVRIAAVNGLLLGLLAFIFVGLYVHIAKDATWTYAFSISGCVGVSLFVAMIVSGFLGTVIPMFFNKLGVDPAVASGPLITTVNDLVAVITYYGLSGIILIGLLHLV